MKGRKQLKKNEWKGSRENGKEEEVLGKYGERGSKGRRQETKEAEKGQK